MQEKHRNPVLGHGHHFLFCFHRTPEHPSVVATRAPLTCHPSQDPYVQLQQSPSCSSPDFQGQDLRLPLVVTPHAHSVPQVSGIWSCSLSACKGQFLGEPSLMNLAFLSHKGKSMRAGVPGPSPHSGPEPSRAQAGGSKQEPRLCFPEDIWSCQGLCWNIQGPVV